MRIVNSFVCPKCGTAFPLFISPSRWVRVSVFTLWVRCSHCGAICRLKVTWDALWAWPVTLGLVILLLGVVKTTPFFIELHRNDPSIYGAIGGLAAGLLFGLGIRRGCRLVIAPATTERPHALGWQDYLLALCVLIIVAVLALITGSWLACAIGLGIGMLVWAGLYLLGQKISD